VKKSLVAALAFLGVSGGTLLEPAAAQLRGDANCNGTVNAADIDAVVAIVFGGANTCATADVNDDGAITSTDVVGVLLAFAPPGTATVTPTITDTPPPTVTPTITQTPTTTRTPTITGTPSRTGSPTRTGTPTRSGTPTRTASRTPTSTRTVTPTPTASITRTPTASRTPSRSPTPPNTPTVSRTPTISPTPTVSRTPTPTIPIGPGPVITFFGLTNASNFLLDEVETLPDGTKVFLRPSGSQFFVVVEARPGLSGRQPSTNLVNANANIPPDFRIWADRNLGDGSTAVCDVGPVPELDIGGVPGIPPAQYDPNNPTVAQALNDWGCRFSIHNSADACTKPDPLTEVSRFVGTGTTLQVCSEPVLGAELGFPFGDTTVTMQWRDSSGNISDPTKIIIRRP